jgi:hypothetical protein
LPLKDSSNCLVSLPLIQAHLILLLKLVIANNWKIFKNCQ